MRHLARYISCSVTACSSRHAGSHASHSRRVSPDTPSGHVRSPATDAVRSAITLSPVFSFQSSTIFFQMATALGHLWCKCAAVSSVLLPFFRQYAHSAFSPLHFFPPIMRLLCTVAHRCSASSGGMAQWPSPAAILPIRGLTSSSGTPASMATCLPPGANTLGTVHFSARSIALTWHVPAP